VDLSAINVTRSSIGIDVLSSTSLSIRYSTFLEQVSWDIYFSNVRDSTVWHNNFVGQHAHAFSTRGGANEWNFAGIGNFWYPTTYVDADSNGIGDSPVMILGGSNESDPFPRMLAWWHRGPSLNGTAPGQVVEDRTFDVFWNATDDLVYVSTSLVLQDGGVVNALNASWASVTRA